MAAGSVLILTVIWPLDGEKLTTLGFILIPTAVWLIMAGIRLMATGWKKLNGTWYYLKSDGTMMRNGWLKIKGKWYYFDSDGAMAGKGWHKINGNYYYMYSSGEMAADAWIDGYYVNASGTWIPNKTRSYKAAYAQFLR